MADLVFLTLDTFLPRRAEAYGFLFVLEFFVVDVAMVHSPVQ